MSSSTRTPREGYRPARGMVAEDAAMDVGHVPDRAGVPVLVEAMTWSKHRARGGSELNQNEESHDFQVIDDNGWRWLWTPNFEKGVGPQVLQFCLFVY